MSEWKRAVVRVWNGLPNKGGEFRGTAFLISPAYLLTAKHVIEDVSQEKIFLQGPAWDDGGIYGISECFPHDSNDVALLKLKKPANTATVIPLASEQIELQPGEKVTLAGYSTSDAGMETLEIQISAYDGVYDLEMTHSAVSKGMSGGSVIKDGKLVGIIRARSQDASHSYLLRLNAFREFIHTYITVQKTETTKTDFEQAKICEKESIESVRSRLDKVFQELIRLDCKEHVAQFSKHISHNKVGAFVIHGKSKYSLRFLMKRIFKCINGDFEAIPFDLTGNQFTYRGFDSNQSCGFDIQPLLDSLAYQFKCNNSLKNIASKFSSKLKKNNVILILDLDSKCDFNVIKDFWFKLSENISSKSDKLFLLMLIVDDIESDIGFIDIHHDMCTPNIPIKLPMLDKYCEKDLKDWIKNFLDMYPDYQGNYCSEKFDKIWEDSKNGYPDLVIKYICIHLCRCELEDAMLGIELKQWLRRLKCL